MSTPFSNQSVSWSTQSTILVDNEEAIVDDERANAVWWWRWWYDADHYKWTLPLLAASLVLSMTLFTYIFFYIHKRLVATVNSYAKELSTSDTDHRASLSTGRLRNAKKSSDAAAAASDNNYNNENNYGSCHTISEWRPIFHKSSLQAEADKTSMLALSFEDDRCSMASNELIAHVNRTTSLLNYSLSVDAPSRSLCVNVISAENVSDPKALSSSPTTTTTSRSLADLSIYVRVELGQSSGPAVASANARGAGAGTTGTQLAKTRVIRSTTSPVYDESFRFKLPSRAALERDPNPLLLLTFSVCNSNRYGRDQILGRFVHSLDASIATEAPNSTAEQNSSSSISRSSADSDSCQVFSRQLDASSSSSPLHAAALSAANRSKSTTSAASSNLGQLHLSLIYNSMSNTLVVHLIKATRLRLPDTYLNASSKKPNAFVKAYMLVQGQRVAKRQSKTVEQNVNPLFDELFEFNLSSLTNQTWTSDADMKTTGSSSVAGGGGTSDAGHIQVRRVDGELASRIQLVFLVMDYDKVEKSDVIGKCDLASRVHDEELRRGQMHMASAHVNMAASIDDYDETSFITATAIANAATAAATDNNSDTTPTSTKSNASSNTPAKWYDIFYKTNKPVLCSLQIKQFN